jgi:hypothetical protein
MARTRQETKDSVAERRLHMQAAKQRRRAPIVLVEEPDKISTQQHLACGADLPRSDIHPLPREVVTVGLD